MTATQQIHLVQSGEEIKEPAVAFTLFLYREILKKRRQSVLRKTHTKLCLTHELVNKTIKNIGNCTADDLQALTRESVFKRNLQREIEHRSKLLRLEMWQYQKQHKMKLQKEGMQPSSHEQQQSCEMELNAEILIS